MTFDEWWDAQRPSFPAAQIRDWASLWPFIAQEFVGAQKGWHAAQEAMRERAADHVERDARLRIPKKIAADIRALRVE